MLLKSFFFGFFIDGVPLTRGIVILIGFGIPITEADRLVDLLGPFLRFDRVILVVFGWLVWIIFEG